MNHIKKPHRMTTFRLLISIIILATIESCTNTNADKKLDSTNFYSGFKSDFLKSDLTKYNYDPRGHFTPLDSDFATFYRILVLRDSSLRILGNLSFTKDFQISIDSIFNGDVRLSKLNDSSYIIRSPNEEEPLTYIIPKQATSVNIVDYFVNLKKLINQFKILEIASHPGVNTKKIIFSSNDYLIYRPDSLVFRNHEDTDFMKFLFKNGKQLDNNWYQFNDTIDTDYQ